MLQLVRRAWRTLLPAGLRRQAAGISPHIVRGLLLLQRKRRGGARPGPLIVSGFLSEGFGIGRAGQYTAKALEERDLSPVRHDLRSLLDSEGLGASRLFPDQPGGVLIIHANAPEALVALSRIAPEDLRGRHLIGYWVYELPGAPAEHRRIAKLFDEIWFPSAFARDAAGLTGVTTRVLPHPVPLREPTPPEDDLVIAAMGDARSSLDRKNVKAALRIYTEAVPAPQPGLRLILKLNNMDPKQAASALEIDPWRDDIELMTERLSEDAMDTLLASVSIFLSPHRAEGFGLVLLETMARGGIILSTRWSGEASFLPEEDAATIPHRLVPVADSSGVYENTQAVWADPDEDAAAAKLAALIADNDLRSRLSEENRQAAAQCIAAWDEPDFLESIRRRMRGD